jgi:dTDP-4-amino-4,6-dideoxygalactose transaminase
MFDVGPTLRHLFTSGKEGLPQELATEFATRWAAHCQCRYALPLPHGTDALRIALAAALDHDGLDYGGEVIVPNLSFIASATAPLDRCCGIALVDVDPETLVIAPERVEEAIVPGRTRAIMPVHLFGHPANMTELRRIADRYGLKLIEDAAQAHDAAWMSQPVGSWGDAAGFSFQSFKNLSCGEGGALTTNDAALFARAYSLHNAGRGYLERQRWQHESLGWNCRLGEYQAAVLLSRLKHFARLQARRRESFFILRKLLHEIPCVAPLGLASGVTQHGVHMLAMRYLPHRCGGLPVDDFLELCRAEGAPLFRSYERTLAQQPAIQKLARKYPDFVRVLPTPVADEAVRQLIYIPHEALLADGTAMRDIADCLRKVYEHFRQRGERESQAHDTTTLAVAGSNSTQHSGSNAR